MVLEADRNTFPDPDAAYRCLIEAHRGLTAEESAALDARLVLILANQIGDRALIEEAIALARATLPVAKDRSGTE